ncbi:MAG: response regulator transcription factor [Bdellovibrionales bacterium]|nr:response regulator transcription factor [Bdellovibrionales bacterium]
MEVSKKVLIVEDESDIANLIHFHLNTAGFTVMVASSSEEARHRVAEFSPDLVLLDIMLPGASGIEFCRWLRSISKSSVPVIMLTALDTEDDVVKGLEVGADDYVAKPFSPTVLISRVKAALRRTNDFNSQPKRHLNFGPLKLDIDQHTVYLSGDELKLTISEFSLLKTFLTQPGRVFTRQQLIDTIRGQDYAVTDRTIDFQMVGLRRKLGEMGQNIETVRGIGYRLRGEL